MALSLALVGCGAMGSALLTGWLTLSNSAALFDKFWVVAPRQDTVSPFFTDSRVRWFASPDLLPKAPDVLVFAVKPFLLKDLLPLYKPFHSLVISVAAGKPLSFYEEFLSPTLPIIRAMPNIPVSIHKGVIGLLSNAHVTAEQYHIAEECFRGLGYSTWVTSNNDLDKITAISGSGPAYVFYLIESFARAAESLGFDKKKAMELALHTFWGASTYAHHTTEPPAVLRQKVTSPQGTTTAALQVLEAGHLNALIETAVKAAYTRARELGT